jgi:uncharacterized protein (DUF58 family)
MRPRTLSERGAPVPPLLDDAELDRLRLLTLQARGRRRAASAASGWGDRPARAHGPGLELHDVRAYQAGDDLRHLDWRATARSGRPMTKVFVQEQARRLCLLVDRRPSMMFGTRRELKAATAARTAAMLAFLALAERDAVAGLVIDHPPQTFPAARRLEDVLPLLRAAAAPAPLPQARPAAFPATRDLRAPLGAEAGRAGVLYLIGDFNDVLRGEAGIADYLPDRRPGTVIALRILDPGERALGNAGVVRLRPTSGGPAVAVDTGDAGLRARYQALVEQRGAELRRQCEGQGVRLFEIRNDLDLPAQLEPLL